MTTDNDGHGHNSRNCNPSADSEDQVAAKQPPKTLNKDEGKNGTRDHHTPDGHKGSLVEAIGQGSHGRLQDSTCRHPEHDQDPYR